MRYSNTDLFERSALCAAYAGLGLRGVSVLFGSGDGGVSGLHYPSETCTTFVPTFPSGCPLYVQSAQRGA